jgi:hypothetical protein
MLTKEVRQQATRFIHITPETRRMLQSCNKETGKNLEKFGKCQGVRKVVAVQGQLNNLLGSPAACRTGGRKLYTEVPELRPHETKPETRYTTLYSPSKKAVNWINSQAELT